MCLALGLEGGEICDGPKFLWVFIPQSQIGSQESPVSCTDDLSRYCRRFQYARGVK